MRRPAFQFYPADWRKDSALQSCSTAAKGLWIEMMCIAHECSPYGVLSINGKPMTTSQIARLAGESEKGAAKLIAELEGAGVFNRDAQGAIFSRRMLRDEQTREARAKGGEAGAEYGAKGAEHGAKGGRPPKEKPEETPPSDNAEGGLKGGSASENKPPPSSSSSSSPSSSEGESPPASRSPSRKKPMPNNFGISDRVRAWAKEKGYTQLEAHFENFVGKVKAKGYTYADWDEGFMGAIRNNWAKLTPVSAPGPKKLTVIDRADLDYEKKYGTAESLGHLMQKLGVTQ